jgi:hypothetical protein
MQFGRGSAGVTAARLFVRESSSAFARSSLTFLSSAYCLFAYELSYLTT